MILFMEATSSDCTSSVFCNGLGVFEKRFLPGLDAYNRCLKCLPDCLKNGEGHGDHGANACPNTSGNSNTRDGLD